ncbi:MAG: hypothetical protein ABW185_29880 [Sedimenticola sp.]
MSLRNPGGYSTKSLATDRIPGFRSAQPRLLAAAASRDEGLEAKWYPDNQ